MIIFLFFCGLLRLYEHYGSLQTLQCSDWWRNHEGSFWRNHEGVFCHPLNHSPSNSKEKTTRQTENHSQFFRRSSIYTPVHILLPFDFFDGFKSWFWKWVKCYGHYLLVFKWPILGMFTNYTDKRRLFDNVFRYRLIGNEREFVYSKFLLIKSSKKNLISLPVFYLIIWLMKPPKNFEKISILKMWQLFSFWGIKTYFGKLFIPKMMHFQACNLFL